MIESAKDKAIVAEVQMLEKVFFSKAELEISIVKKDRAGYGPYAILYDHRRKGPKGKTIKRTFYEAEELRKHMKKLCSAKGKVSDEPISDAEILEYREFKAWLKEQNEVLYDVGYVTMRDRTGITSTGAARRPYTHRAYGFHSPNRTFTSLDALKAHVTRHLEFCVPKADYDAVGAMNQRCLKDQVHGRIRVNLNFGEAPTYSYAKLSSKAAIPDLNKVSLKEALAQARKALRVDKFS